MLGSLSNVAVYGTGPGVVGGIGIIIAHGRP